MSVFKAKKDFIDYSLKNPLKFDIFLESQKSAYNKIKSHLEENTIIKPYKNKRFSLILYGSPGIGKTFIVNYVLKKLEEENKIINGDYYYCYDFKEKVCEIHDRLMYEYYRKDVINKFLVTYLKEKFEDQGHRLVIFDGLNEEFFLEIDFKAAGFKFNRNGKGIVWILSFPKEFITRVKTEDLVVEEFDDLGILDLMEFKNHYFKNIDISIDDSIKNIWDLLNLI